MERAGRLIGQLNRNRQVMTNEEFVRAAWPLAVGKRIAAHTAVAALVRNRLVVEVQDMTWQRQLNSLTPHIVKNMADIVGQGIITDVEFRPMTPRRQPQRAEAPRQSVLPPLLRDEAEAIADPGLRRVYRISRKKATA